MTPPILQLLAYLVAWSPVVAGLVFTNSFEGWTGNKTYRISWEGSSSDPSYYDLELVRPHGVYSVNIPTNASWPEEWSFKFAIQIPRNGDRFIQVPLGQEVWPGVYFWRTRGENRITPVSNTFLISSSSGSTNPTTITSFIPVTATEDVVETTDGHFVTHKSSEVYTSAIVYTTIIVISDGKGSTRNKVPLLIGLALVLTFLITLPIVLWLIFRYRRHPGRSSNKIRLFQADSERILHSSDLGFMPSNHSVVGSTIVPAISMSGSTQKVWVVIDGKKRLVTAPQDTPQSTIPGTHSDPFADPFAPDSPLYTRQFFIATDQNASDSNISSNSTSHINPLLAPANTCATSLGGTLSYGSSNMDIHTDPTAARQRFGEKQQARQIYYSQSPALPEADIALRMIVPGRAVDMGSLGTNHVPDVDEDGLLPPDYVQATQPVPPGQSSQTVPDTRR
ncbi:unnamed protein product [Rhizoctonia solani]|uniref:Uncharacterized protein n=1 Tax=Rhizoctonia solani TaxID=456999 RepID=A0A8H3C4G2_9AGAM|nr:unnamed protein product [Rhizoctonia solani]